MKAKGILYGNVPGGAASTFRLYARGRTKYMLYLGPRVLYRHPLGRSRPRGPCVDETATTRLPTTFGVASRGDIGSLSVPALPCPPSAS